MNIKTKFELGEKVYCVYKEDNIIKLFVDEVAEIVVSNDGIDYYGEIMCEEFKENEVVAYNDKEGLLNKIEELSSEKEENNEQ